MTQYDAQPGHGPASAARDVAFRRVLPAECGAAREALASCGRDDWSADPEGYPGCMLAQDTAAGRAWGLFDGQGLAAYGVLAFEPDEEYPGVAGFETAGCSVIHRLYTAGRAQRRGLGARLVDELAALARANGARHVYVDMVAGIPGLEEFYVRCGFARLGEFEREIGQGVMARFLLLSRGL